MIKILDKYKILEIIEDNNSTIICNAINIETNKKVILKLFDKGIYDKEDFNKLEENINSSNINKNSNLIKVYDVGMYSYNKTTYYAIALEYINGESLDTIVENSTFNEEEGLEIIKQIINGLSELHNLGIIYRNLTSENIYLDTKGLIKLDTTGYISTKQEREKENIVDASTDIYLLGTLFYKIMTKETINIDDRPSYIDKEKFSTLAVSILEKSIYQDILHRYKSLNEFLIDIKLENNYILGNFEENNKQEQKIVKSKKKYIKYIVGCIVLGIVFISVKVLGNQSVNKVEEKNEQTLVLNYEENIENDIKETIEEDNISDDLQESTLNDNKESLNSNQIIQSTSTSSSNNQNRPGSNSLGSTSSNKKPSSNSNSTNTQSKPSSGSSSNTESNFESNLGDNNESDSESNLEQIKPEETPDEAPQQKPEETPNETPSETPDQSEDQDSEDITE